MCTAWICLYRFWPIRSCSLSLQYQTNHFRIVLWIHRVNYKIKNYGHLTTMDVEWCAPIWIFFIRPGNKYRCWTNMAHFEKQNRNSNNYSRESYTYHIRYIISILYAGKNRAAVLFIEMFMLIINGLNVHLQKETTTSNKHLAKWEFVHIVCDDDVSVAARTPPIHNLKQCCTMELREFSMYTITFSTAQHGTADHSIDAQMNDKPWV